MNIIVADDDKVLSKMICGVLNEGGHITLPAYDSMQIARIKGKRREVRRMLAQRSKELLSCYRRGDSIAEACPLKKALGS